mgnify:CR=1 FL=1
MVGITSYGAYIPFYRLSRARISEAWGGRALPGEKAVANYDEDSITMAVAAAMDCLTGVDIQTIDSLYFASTTSAYKEKQASATVATALDLRRETFTADFSGSLRAGTNAIRAAMDSISSGSARNVLICAADMRLGLPMGEKELSFGDGAVALLLGSERVIATIEGSYTISDEIIDIWRLDKDTFVRSWEDRFIREKGYASIIPEAITNALEKYSLTAKEFSKVVFYARDPRDLATVARELGFDIKAQVQDLLYDTVGNTGTALAPMLLVAALEEAKAGDRILFASYGDGCDVYVLKVTPEIENARDRRGVKGHLAAKEMLASYQKYMRWREIIPVEPAARPPLEQPSAVALWRDRKGGLALHGVKCKQCGTPQYPPQRVCMKCQAKDDFEDYSFADRKGVLFTFSHDNLAASIDPPTTVAVVDFEGGGRIVCDMTDRGPQQIKVGMSVEMTFRKIYEVGGIPNYWWKCRPVRC